MNSTVLWVLAAICGVLVIVFTLALESKWRKSDYTGVAAILVVLLLLVAGGLIFGYRANKAADNEDAQASATNMPSLPPSPVLPSLDTTSDSSSVPTPTYTPPAETASAAPPPQTRAATPVFRKLSLQEAIGDGSTNSTVEIGDHTFRYAYAPNLNYFGYTINTEYHTFMRSDASKCASLSLDFAASADKPVGVDSYDLQDSVRLIQESRDPVAISVPSQSVRHRDVRLTVNGSFQLQVRGSFFLYVNGSGSCTGQPGLVVGFD